MRHLFLLLSACSTIPLPEACEDIVAPPVAACVGSDTIVWEGYGTLAHAAEGTVVSVTTGARPDACLVDIGNTQVSDGVVVEIEDADGAIHVVAFSVPDLAGTLVAEGDYVYLNADYTFGEFGPDVGSVSLALDSGAIVLVVAEAGQLSDLPAAFENVTEGETRCTEDDGCGTYSKYDLDVTFAGTSGPVRYGESLALDGGGRFVHGGYERQAEGQTGVCPDWYVAHVTVAVVDEDA